ncbi:RHS repeat-associated core domain-containing protein [Pseudomonas sp. NPDC087029]|uniref:RHS repeat-associated core domain-containing protein n=1 Tax=Pseudomonas sp. NPDC087029 TaxID=3364433 RepID=UPI00381B4BAB
MNDTLFFYQRDKLVSLRQGSQQRAIFRNADIPLAQWQTGEASTSGLLAGDDKGSVLNVQSNNESQAHLYSVYGHNPALPSQQTLLSFTGQRLQPEVCAYLLGNGYRAYSPGLMRFEAPDSWSPFGRGGLNAYSYCAGDPVNRTDPSGHMVGWPALNRARSASQPTMSFQNVKPAGLKRSQSLPNVSGTTSFNRASESPDPFARIGEPDVFESIIRNFTLNEATAFANTSRSNSSYTKPIIKKYLSRVKENDASMGAARAGVLPRVPKAFGQSLGLELNPYLREINSLQFYGLGTSNIAQELGGVRGIQKLLRLDRETEARARLVRSDSVYSLLGD